MIAKILRWGNSYGIRLTKREVEEAGLHEGEEVVVDVKARPGQRVDVSDVQPLFEHGSISVDHDEEEWA